MHPVILPLQCGGTTAISYLLTEAGRAVGVDEWEREVTRERSRPEERGFYSSSQKHAPSRPGTELSIVGDCSALQ
ncbi:hypothetical protein GB937_005678 [Aspergillus fischeri]|nr:hypothetical protein GB937_005678 [Aspergillus fischeri]